MQVGSVLQYHAEIHETETDLEVKAVLSADDVVEVKSSTRNMNILSIRFEGCSLVYPLLILRNLCYKPPWKPHYIAIIKDLM